MRTKYLLGPTLFALFVACGGSISSIDNAPSSTSASTDAGPASPSNSPSGRPSPVPIGDASTAPACFDSNGDLLDTFRSCKTNDDCTTVSFERNCCGLTLFAGVNQSAAAQAQACGDDRAKTFPGCGCAMRGPVADDGTIQADNQPVAVSCSSEGRCVSSFASATCGTTSCAPGQTCCDGFPLDKPTCVEGNACPKSRREYKKDIAYLGEEERQALREEILRTRLTTYRYKTEAESEPTHLGFIIDDMDHASHAVAADKKHVDLYGYTSMTVATVQLQQQQIVELQKQVDELRRELAHGKRR